MLSARVLKASIVILPKYDGFKISPTGGTCVVLNGDSVTIVDFTYESSEFGTNLKPGSKKFGYVTEVATTSWR